MIRSFVYSVGFLVQVHAVKLCCSEMQLNKGASLNL